MRSSASMRRAAASSEAALTVMRTFNPSMPLARKASVGAPGPAESRETMWSASFSASPDSLSPHVRRVRERITATVPARRARSGSTAPETISCSS